MSQADACTTGPGTGPAVGDGQRELPPGTPPCTRQKVPAPQRLRSSAAAGPAAHGAEKSNLSLKQFTVGRKDVRKLSPHELIAALSLWCLDKLEDLSVADHRALLELNIHFLSVKAMTDDLKDSTHVSYDTAIQGKAETYGLLPSESLPEAHQGASVIHYGAQHMKTKTKRGTTTGNKRGGMNGEAANGHASTGIGRLQVGEKVPL